MSGQVQSLDPDKDEQKVRQSVHRIRDAEIRNHNLLPSGVFMTPWDVDELKLLWDESQKPFIIDFFGEELVVSGDPIYKDPDGKIVIGPSSLFYLQFVNPDSAKQILSVMRMFRGQVSGISEYSKPMGEMDKVNSFCNKLDKVIAREALLLASDKIIGIFDKMVKEMGGNMISQNDRVANRVKYFLKISDRFKKDRMRWQSEMLRLGLIG